MFPVGMWKIHRNKCFTTTLNNFGEVYPTLQVAFEGRFSITMSFGYSNSGTAFRNQWYFCSPANIGKFFRGKRS